MFVPLTMRLTWWTVLQAYATTCQGTQNCQSQLVNIDSTSSVGIYSLSTVDTTWQLSVNAQGVINRSSNPSGFADTVTVWTH